MLPKPLFTMLQLPIGADAVLLAVAEPEQVGDDEELDELVELCRGAHAEPQLGRGGEAERAVGQFVIGLRDPPPGLKDRRNIARKARSR